MSRLPDAPFALGLSGGGDSLALLSLLCRTSNLASVLIVDHGLRPGSQDEARQAKALAGTLGHNARILTHTPTTRITSAVQRKARQARYGLMGQVCREEGLSYLVTAHHADDQAETILMRLERGSGWRGVSGMGERVYAPVWPELAGVTLIRPALGVSRSDLRAHLGSLKPIADPTNRNRAFTRVRMRQRLQDDPALRADMLALGADMARGREVERDHVRAELEGSHLSDQGLLTIPHCPSRATLSIIAPMIGGQSGPASRTRIKEAHASLVRRKTVTLGSGCLAGWKDGILRLMRDPVAITGRRDRQLMPTATPASVTITPRVWDGRFLISGEGGLIRPKRMGNHAGFVIEDSQSVQVKSLIQARLDAYLAGM